MAKETFNKVKSKPTEREKVFVKYTTDEWLISKIHKELKNLNNNKESSWEMGEGHE